jgi:hypothetical protein
MSYSFQVKAATKAEVKAAVEAEFDKVVQFQPVHARDKAAVLANVDAVIALVEDNADKDVHVACHGSVGWDGSDLQIANLHSASVACSVWTAPR